MQLNHPKTDTSTPRTHNGIAFYNPLAFWVGTLAVVGGVGLHFPMFFHAAAMDYKMVGMPMDNSMMLGMGLIVAGVLAAGYGMFPGSVALKRRRQNEEASGLRPQAMDDAPLTAAHWKLFLVLVVALIVDVMKPATLGFVLPGIAQEYGLPKSTLAFLPLVALTGTVIGSVVWGVLGDVIGRRASILLAALLFIGTAICGAMPSFAGNVAMCFLMGMSAGGLLPIAFALLAETVPARHRGWLIVLLGGIGAVGGYLAASGSAALLEPTYGWRILWLLGLPTGVIMVALNRYIPESPRFLLSQGRFREARAVMEHFGVRMVPALALSKPYEAPSRINAWQLFKRPYASLTLGLTLCGVAWGLVNFGFLLWLPTNLRALGLGSGASDALLAKSALIAFPGAVLVAWLYSRWSSKKTLVLFILLTAAALLGFALLGEGAGQSEGMLTVLVVTLLVSSSGVIAMLIPYGAEIYPLQVRTTGTGLVAASSKLGGIAGAAVGLAALAPSLVVSALAVMVPVAFSALVLSRKGIETRGRGLEEISMPPSTLPQRSE